MQGSGKNHSEQQSTASQSARRCTAQRAELLLVPRPPCDARARAQPPPATQSGAHQSPKRKSTPQPQQGLASPYGGPAHASRRAAVPPPAWHHPLRTVQKRTLQTCSDAQLRPILMAADRSTRPLTENSPGKKWGDRRCEGKRGPNAHATPKALSGASEEALPPRPSHATLGSGAAIAALRRTRAGRWQRAACSMPFRGGRPAWGTCGERGGTEAAGPEARWVSGWVRGKAA